MILPLLKHRIATLLSRIQIWATQIAGTELFSIRVKLPVPVEPLVIIYLNLAYTFFNDTFQLYNGFNTSAPEISINQQGISWDGDQGQKFRRSNSS